MIVCVTGHRPNKLGGYKVPNPIYNSVMTGLNEALDEIKPQLLITGMALGVDQWAAELCILKGIPFLAAVPFEGQESVWPEHARHKYHFLLSKAQAIYIISPGMYTPEKMQVRNKWMVDNSNIVLPVYDGTDGGTGNCVKYALSVSKKMRWIQYTNAMYSVDGKIRKEFKESSASKGEVMALMSSPSHTFKKLHDKFKVETKPIEAVGSTAASKFVKSIKEKAMELAKQELTYATDKAYALNEAAIVLAKAQAEKEEALALQKKNEKLLAKIQKATKALEDQKSASPVYSPANVAQPVEGLSDSPGIQFKHKRAIKL